MNKTFAIMLALTIFIATTIPPFLSTVAGSELSDFYTYGGGTSENTPPTITFNLENGSILYNFGNLTLGFYSHQNPPPLRLVFRLSIYSVSYKASWENEPHQIYNWSINDVSDLDDDDLNPQDYFSYNFTGIPEGPQHIEVNVTGGGYRAFLTSVPTESRVFREFYGRTMSSLHFTVLVPPIISNLSIQNQTFNSTNIPLVFNVNKEYSWSGYSLDDNANVTIAGNSTLTGLSAGNHSLVVLVNDTFGAITKSELMNFTVKEPETFDVSLPIIGASVAIPIIVSVVLMVYFRRRNKITKGVVSESL